MKKVFLLFAFVQLSFYCPGQALKVTASDTASERIRTAIQFFGRYLNCFSNGITPDYTQYWSNADCKRSSEPDDMLYTIQGDVPTYSFCASPVLFFASDEGEYIHLKTLFASSGNSSIVNVWAITNHYVTLNSEPKFISEIELHKSSYSVVKNGNITYHFPATTTFSYANSDRMLERLKQIEQQWGFRPVDIHYYFAATAAELAKMRGMDYNFAMDQTTPSGITRWEHLKIFCQGLGEGYLHEVLHLYFNPVYEKSPMCHALIYYLAGGIGKDFNWMIRRMNSYLLIHPDIDLSNYETLRSEDPMLHIDHVTKGLLCKMLDEKDGVAGQKRALQYKTVEALLQQEFGVDAAHMDAFLKSAFKRYGKSN